MPESMTQLLADLPDAQLDHVRAERIRSACHARLARQAARTSASDAPGPPGTTVQLWQPLLAALGVTYFAQVIGLAFQLYRLR
jgi:hypothetical protein